MTTQTTTKLRNEWKSLNLKLQQIERVIKMNKITDSEYLQWVSDLKSRRDYLTNII